MLIIQFIQEKLIFTSDFKTEYHVSLTSQQEWITHLLVLTVAHLSHPGLAQNKSLSHEVLWVILPVVDGNDQ